MRRSNTPPPTPFTFEKLPSAKRYNAAATLAAAGAFSNDTLPEETARTLRDIEV